jgi:amino acid transporter
MAEATLKRQLGRVELLAQSVANMAPTGAGGVIIPAVYAMSGRATWFIFPIAAGIMLLLTRSISIFAKRSATTGALYSFVGQGLGPLAAVITGWAMLIAYLMSASSSLIGATIYAAAFFPQTASIGLIAGLIILFGVMTWLLAYRDVRVSTRSMLALEGVSIGLIALCAIVYLTHVTGLPAATLADIDPSRMRGGLVLAMFAFTGFESAATLGREAQRPESIPAIMARALLLVGAYFCLIALGLVVAFADNPLAIAKDPAPLATLARLAGFGDLSQAVAAMVVLSSFACGLASVIAGARVLLAMAEHRLVHRQLVRIHARHATPHLAVSAIALAAILPALGLTVARVPLLETVDYLATIGTFGFLVAYMLVILAAPIFLRRLGLLTRRALLLAIVSAPLIGFALLGSVYPAPDGPMALLPYIFAGLMVPGIVSYIVMRVRRPSLVQEIRDSLRSQDADIHIESSPR